MYYGFHDNERRCGNCLHWNEYYKAIAPTRSGMEVEVCPCMAAVEGDEDAPLADAGGLPRGPVIMTEYSHNCDAFALHRDEWEAYADLNRTQQELHLARLKECLW